MVPADIFAFGFVARMVFLRWPPDVERVSLVVGGRRSHMIASMLAILPIVRGHSLPHKREVYLKIK